MNKRICLTVMLLMIIYVVSAQKKITGTIIDAATNQGLQGATISDIKNKTSTLSDQNGNFILPETDSILVTSIGYNSNKKAVNKEKNVISLPPSFGSLNEVIVSGSRELQKRTEVPVAIDLISKTQINDTKATRLDMLVNKVPGVFMVDLGNEQHSMAIRQPLGYN